MKKSNYTTLVILGGLLLATAACATAVDDRGKMPISTSSVTAKEAYLKGRDLAERLKAADARKEFEKAVTEDPNFALAHLNVALNATSAKMFFGSLAKAVALVDRVSAAERLWIKGQEAGANGDPASQKKLWQELAGKYPGDERAQTCSAVSILDNSSGKKPFSSTKKRLLSIPIFHHRTTNWAMLIVSLESTTKRRGFSKNISS